MENYPEHIYPILPKDVDGETFRIQQTCCFTKTRKRG